MTIYEGKFKIEITGAKRKPLTLDEIEDSWKKIKAEEKRSGRSSHLTKATYVSMMFETNKAIRKHNRET